MADADRSGNGVDGTLDSESVINATNPLSALLGALSAYNYTLAVVPVERGLALTDDVWAEFRPLQD